LWGKVVGLTPMALLPDCRFAFGRSGFFMSDRASLWGQSGKVCYNRGLRLQAAAVTNSGEMDEWFKSHAWKACVGS
jgi:hypothetical protein